MPLEQQINPGADKAESQFSETGKPSNLLLASRTTSLSLIPEPINDTSAQADNKSLDEKSEPVDSGVLQLPRDEGNPNKTNSGRL
jgi:hypothetical protein